MKIILLSLLLLLSFQPFIPPPPKTVLCTLRSVGLTPQDQTLITLLCDNTTLTITAPETGPFAPQLRSLFPTDPNIPSSISITFTPLR